LFQTLLDAVAKDHPGAALTAAQRSAMVESPTAPAEVLALSQAAGGLAHEITDAQVAELLANGVTEEMVFETAVTSAVRAGRQRMDAGLKALEGAKKK
jgi:hypothetical protein